MKNWIDDGEGFEFTGQAKTVGQGVLQGNLFGVATKTVGSSEVGHALRKGKYTLPKLSTDNMATVGAKLYWHNVNGNLQLTQIAGQFAGYVAKVAGAGVTSVEVILAGGASDV